jgi:hypothetical protein
LRAAASFISNSRTPCSRTKCLGLNFFFFFFDEKWKKGRSMSTKHFAVLRPCNLFGTSFFLFFEDTASSIGGHSLQKKASRKTPAHSRWYLICGGPSFVSTPLLSLTCLHWQHCCCCCHNFWCSRYKKKSLICENVPI